MDAGQAFVLDTSRNFWPSGTTQNWNLTAIFINKLTSGSKFVYEHKVGLYFLCPSICIHDGRRSPSEYQTVCFSWTKIFICNALVDSIYAVVLLKTCKCGHEVNVQVPHLFRLRSLQVALLHCEALLEMSV